MACLSGWPAPTYHRCCFHCWPAPNNVSITGEQTPATTTDPVAVEQSSATKIAASSYQPLPECDASPVGPPGPPGVLSYGWVAATGGLCINLKRASPERGEQTEEYDRMWMCSEPAPFSTPMDGISRLGSCWMEWEYYPQFLASKPFLLRRFLIGSLK